MDDSHIRADTAEAASSGPQSAAVLLRLLTQGHPLRSLLGHSEQGLEAIYAVAHSVYEQGRFEDARRMFGHLEMHDHMDRRFQLGYGACLQMLGRHADAAKFYGIASMMDLTDPRPVVHMAECHLALGDPARAEEALLFAQGQTRDEPRYAALHERVQGLLGLLVREGIRPPDATLKETL